MSDKQQNINTLEKDVEYLRKNIPPDDIYLFAATTFSMASEILACWQTHGDLKKHLEEDDNFYQAVVSIAKMQYVKSENLDFGLTFTALEE